MKTEIIPVIHMTSEKQVLVNVKTCIDCGIRKVFIINHAVSVDELLKCARAVKEYYPSVGVGVNILGIDAETALSMKMPFVNALWCDETITAKKIQNRVFEGMVFGGVAFKYQPQPSDLGLACRESMVTTDVATTSGSGTGKPAHLHKIKLMREYLGEHPLAIASGVSAENVGDYVGLADYLLVATSITDANEMIVKEKLQKLISKINAF
jgi:uncharacterized protein